MSANSRTIIHAPTMGGIIVLLVLFSCTCAAGAGYVAGDTTMNSQVVRVTVRDGSEFIGRIVSESPDSLVLTTVSNIMVNVPRTQIEGIDHLSGMVIDGEYRRADPNRTRLLFAPTARPLRSGQGYISAYEIFFPFLAIGVADILTLGGGMTLFPGATGQIYYLAPKLSLPLHSDVVDLAAGVLYMNVTSEDFKGFGIAYGVGTYGSPYASFTFGLGYGFVEGEFARDPLIVLGGELQVSNSVALVSENWIPVGSDVQILFFGLRFFGEHLAADLAFLYPITKTESEGFPFLPWVGFTYNFGGK
jgi:hypothetical protein